MVRKKIVIDNPTGLHLRPAGTFCKAAIQFESKITVQKITKNENVTAIPRVYSAYLGRVLKIEMK